MTNTDQIEFIRTHLRQPLVFIGMMGAGKTTIAQAVAKRLNADFVDSDREIEEDQKTTVREIFEVKGEAYFRELEKNKIDVLLKTPGRILSVGGGAITTPETAENIFSSSLCLWLDAPVSVLAKRTAETGTRPLLNGKNAEDALAERMEQRRHLYSRAHIHVDAAQSVPQVADNAIGQIYNYLIKQTA